jgi:GAF domain-containing protein
VLSPTPACLLPVNEAQRLQSLRTYNLLQAPPERVFAELVSLSAHVFRLPVSLLGIVGADEVVYKATYGLPGLRVRPRGETFCALAVSQNKSFVFCDVTQAQHASLTEAAQKAVLALGAHFYAGAPLRLPDAQTIGALCVAGFETRPFIPQEQRLLELLAQVVGLTLAARHTCLTSRGLGWVHWQMLEDQLAEAVQTLGAWVQQRLATPGKPLLPVHTLVQQRLYGLQELLRQYQPDDAACLYA